MVFNLEVATPQRSFAFLLGVAGASDKIFIITSIFYTSYMEPLRLFVDNMAKTIAYSSGAQTVARKALCSGPQSNFHWKENLTL